MRGRKPKPVTISSQDRKILQNVADSRTLPFFQVQHARILLAVADGQRIEVIAFQMRCDPSTVWRICRRYQQGGLQHLLADKPRSGRPQEISPPATGPNHRIGLSGTNRHRTAYHTLD